MPGMINRIDYEATVTADGNSDSLDTSGMGQISFTADVSAISGSGFRIQVGLQASDDAVNWNVVHDTRRITANGQQRISGVRVSSKYYRFYWLVGGTSPSCTVKVISTLKDYSPTRTGSMFRYSDLDLKTGSALSTQYSSFSNTEAGVMLVRDTDTSTVVTLKVQGSQDGLNWSDYTGDFTLTSNETVTKDFTGSSHRFFRVIVVTAATGGSTSTAHCLWNSTGGA